MKIKIDNHKTISAEKLMKKINRPKNDLFYTKSIFNSIVAVVKNAFVKKTDSIEEQFKQFDVSEAELDKFLYGLSLKDPDVLAKYYFTKPSNTWVVEDDDVRFDDECTVFNSGDENTKYAVIRKPNGLEIIFNAPESGCLIIWKGSSHADITNNIVDRSTCEKATATDILKEIDNTNRVSDKDAKNSQGIRDMLKMIDDMRENHTFVDYFTVKGESIGRDTDGNLFVYCPDKSPKWVRLSEIENPDEAIN